MNSLDAIKKSQSESFKKKNPHIFQPGDIMNHGHEDDEELEHIAALTAKPAKKQKRIRQSEKPELNKLESEFQHNLPWAGVVAQSIRFKLSTGLHYTPDFFSFKLMTAWEVKGRYAWEDSLVKLRMAAKVWTDIRWILAWKDEQGQWQEQHVLP